MVGGGGVDQRSEPGEGIRLDKNRTERESGNRLEQDRTKERVKN